MPSTFEENRRLREKREAEERRARQTTGGYTPPSSEIYTPPSSEIYTPAPSLTPDSEVSITGGGTFDGGGASGDY